MKNTIAQRQPLHLMSHKMLRTHKMKERIHVLQKVFYRQQVIEHRLISKNNIQDILQTWNLNHIYFFLLVGSHNQTERRIYDDCESDDELRQEHINFSIDGGM